jgi:hypothetical protein
VELSNLRELVEHWVAARDARRQEQSDSALPH